MPFIKSISTYVPVMTGIYTDLSTVWYGNIGVLIVMTVGVNVILPVIVTLFSQLIFKCTTSCDRGGDGKVFNSKTMTRHEFFKVHVGPEFPFELRYSSVRLI